MMLNFERLNNNYLKSTEATKIETTDFVSKLKISTSQESYRSLKIFHKITLSVQAFQKFHKFVFKLKLAVISGFYFPLLLKYDLI